MAFEVPRVRGAEFVTPIFSTNIDFGWFLGDFLERFSMFFGRYGFLMKKRGFSRSGVSPRREHHF